MLCSFLRPALSAAIMVFITSCGAFDSSPPWDTKQMVGDLAAELRQFEGLSADWDQVEVLAWRVDSRSNGPGIAIALLWGRMGPADAPAGWALLQRLPPSTR